MKSVYKVTYPQYNLRPNSFTANRTFNNTGPSGSLYTSRAGYVIPPEETKLNTGFKQNVLPFVAEQPYKPAPLHLTPLEQQQAMVSRRLELEGDVRDTIYKSDYKTPSQQKQYKREFFAKTAIIPPTDANGIPQVTGPMRLAALPDNHVPDQVYFDRSGFTSSLRPNPLLDGQDSEANKETSKELKDAMSPKKVSEIRVKDPMEFEYLADTNPEKMKSVYTVSYTGHRQRPGNPSIYTRTIHPESVGTVKDRHAGLGSGDIPDGNVIKDETGFSHNVQPGVESHPYVTAPVKLTPSQQIKALVSKRLEYEGHVPVSIYKSDFLAPGVQREYRANYLRSTTIDPAADAIASGRLPERTRDASTYPDPDDDPAVLKQYASPFPLPGQSTKLGASLVVRPPENPAAITEQIIHRVCPEPDFIPDAVVMEPSGFTGTIRPSPFLSQTGEDETSASTRENAARVASALPEKTIKEIRAKDPMEFEYLNIGPKMQTVYQTSYTGHRIRPHNRSLTETTQYVNDHPIGTMEERHDGLGSGLADPSATKEVTGYSDNNLPAYRDRRLKLGEQHLRPKEQVQALVSRRLDLEGDGKIGSTIYKSDFVSPTAQKVNKRNFFITTAIGRQVNVVPDDQDPKRTITTITIPKEAEKVMDVFAPTDEYIPDQAFVDKSGFTRSLPPNPLGSTWNKKE